MARGEIVDWKADRGFGFIRPRSGGPDVFLHIRQVRPPGYEPQVGDKVSFSVTQDDQGRSRAAKATIAGVAPTAREWAFALALAVAVGFMLGLYAAQEYRPAFWGYLGMSIVAFAAYGIDKLRAVSGAWRTPEATLHTIGLLGGWPGAVPAQLLFRHKTAKTSFQTAFWLIAGAHIGLWIWLPLSGESPADLLRMILDFFPR